MMTVLKQNKDDVTPVSHYVMTTLLIFSSRCEQRKSEGVLEYLILGNRPSRLEAYPSSQMMGDGIHHGHAASPSQGPCQYSGPRISSVKHQDLEPIPV